MPDSPLPSMLLVVGLSFHPGACPALPDRNKAEVISEVSECFTDSPVREKGLVLV